MSQGSKGTDNFTFSEKFQRVSNVLPTTPQDRKIDASFLKGKPHRQNKADEGRNMVPGELRAESGHREEDEDRERDHFLDDLEFKKRERTAVAFKAEAVGRHLEGIFKERNAPREKDDRPDGPERDELHVLELEVEVPGKRHEDVRDDEKTDGGEAFGQHGGDRKTIMRKAPASLRGDALELGSIKLFCGSFFPRGSRILLILQTFLNKGLELARGLHFDEAVFLGLAALEDDHRRNVLHVVGFANARAFIHIGARENHAVGILLRKRHEEGLRAAAIDAPGGADREQNGLFGLEKIGDGIKVDCDEIRHFFSLGRSY